jgi:hypothetical protein
MFHHSRCKATTMTTTWTDHLIASTLALSLLGCNQPPPPGSDDSETSTDGSETSTDGSETESDTGDDPQQSLYPLVDGARWTYVTTTTGGQVLGMDIVDLQESTWNGMQAWELIDSPNVNGNWDVSTLISDGDLVLRVHREEHDSVGLTAILDYDPGFLRASEAWTEVGIMEEFLYERTAYDANGQNPMVEPRGHTFEVLALDEEVTVPAGTFNCVKVERVRTVGFEAGTLAIFWFAPGVGKVREERPLEMEVEELISVSIPGGVQLP